MDTTKILQLKLTKESLVPFEILEDYKIVLVNKENYNNYLHELSYVSDLMKQDFDWVGIPVPFWCAPPLAMILTTLVHIKRIRRQLEYDTVFNQRATP